MSDKPTRLALGGCCGRMGTLIAKEALKDPAHFILVGGTEQAGHPQIGKAWAPQPALKVSGTLKEALGKANLLIEFTTPEATLSNAEIAAASKVPMVIGTTGFSAEQFDALKELTQQIPIFWSPNMSIGIVLIRRLINATSEFLFNFGLSQETQIQISETHHTQKKDKPSGTAKALAQELLKVTGWLIKDEEIEARREGEAIGTHAVTFQLKSEKITLRHEATDRRIFAQGALLVARNFHGLWKKPGWYEMDDFVSATVQAGART